MWGIVKFDKLNGKQFRFGGDDNGEEKEDDPKRGCQLSVDK